MRPSRVPVKYLAHAVSSSVVLGVQHVRRRVGVISRLWTLGSGLGGFVISYPIDTYG